MSKIGSLGAVLMCLIVWCARVSAQTQPTAGAAAAGPAAAVTVAPTAPAAAIALAGAANPQTPEEFFARARALSDLEAAGIPFHLKATYVSSGDAEFTGSGTYEEWWQSKDLWRKEATLGDYKYVEIQSGGKDTAYGSSDYLPLRLRQTLEAVLVRIAPDTSNSSKWKLKHKKMNGIDFAVLSSENPCSGMKHGMKCVTQDYFTPEGVLRVRVVDVVEYVYNSFHVLHGLAIPASVSVVADGNGILAISLVLLEQLKPDNAKLMADAPPATGLQLITSPITPPVPDSVGLKVVPGKLIRQAPPVYPLEAKQRGETGSVVMNAEIDQKGMVREPYVIHSAGPLLDKSALDAIRGWRYIPATVNGTPISVYTTITVVYKLN